MGKVHCGVAGDRCRCGRLRPFFEFFGGARFASFAFLFSVVPAFFSGGGFAFGGGDALTVAALLHRS